MDFERAEQRFRALQAQHKTGELDAEAFRVEVAKLLLRDGGGVFWMLDGDKGTWFCNRGEGWEPGDPHSESPPRAAPDVERKARRRRLGRLLALGLVSLVLVAVAGTVALWLTSGETAWNLFREMPVAVVQVQVMIASPADGSQVALGQAVAIESTLEATPDLQSVVRVALQVNGQMVDVQSVQTKIQPGQTSLPLSQPWLPDALGEHEIVVTALGSGGEPLGTAAITLQVAEASEALPEPACVFDAAFVADVTIPPGTAFPPGVRMEKVWQVRNSGSCAWGVGYELVQLEGQVPSAQGALLVPQTAAGESADLAVTLWAPVEAGVYANVWQLRTPDGEFFGPTLPLTIHVEALAQESSPPNAPANLEATVIFDGADTRTRPMAVQLTWSDQSDNEDAFRVHRADVEASIGLAAVDTEQFVDEGVACGNTYRYSVVAFNAAGTSALGTTAEVALPPCGPTDEPPTLSLTVVPTQVQASGIFTVVFQADDDLGLDLVVVWGEATDDPALDAGQAFTCTEVICTGSWPITWTQEVSATLTLFAIALDSSGQRSEPARTTLSILPAE